MPRYAGSNGPEPVEERCHVLPFSFPPSGEIVLYQTEDGRTRVECRFEDETIWLTQAQIAELFTGTVRPSTST